MKKSQSTKSPEAQLLPLLKTPELMAKVCGIGENKLRQLMEAGEIEYLLNGNRHLLLDEAVLDYYHRAKVPVRKIPSKDKIA
ncbi:MAG: DNA-binding protein [Oscillospiraceae bacterium]|jgi:hypothetical protein|nr:DNA-binding protein [Oscillospiraceae bacterium]